MEYEDWFAGLVLVLMVREEKRPGEDKVGGSR